jgi:hypothetical protein
MLVFESLSAGVMALAFGMGLVLTLVGIYCVIVWPLTFWDLGNLGLEEYASWTSTVLWSSAVMPSSQSQKAKSRCVPADLGDKNALRQSQKKRSIVPLTNWSARSQRTKS